MSSEREEPRRLQAETLFAAWASRVEAGEELDFEELVRAHAELEHELRELHDDWKQFAPILGEVVPGLIASGDGLVLPTLTRGPDSDEGPPSDELLGRLGIHAPDNKRYRFRARIGQGGGGVVLKVWDSKLNRPLAMKLVVGRAEDVRTGQTPRVDGRTLTRFVDEARIASQLNHPGIVPVHELGADESGRAFFTMKLVKGDNLGRIFDKVKTGADGLSLPRAVSYLLRVCEAMAYAHARGVIHRDLKPENIMVGAYGEVHVMDWGLARVLGEAQGASSSSSTSPASSSARGRAPAPISEVDSLRAAERETTPDSPLATEHGAQVGTPCYMSPEQARGDHAAVGPQSDVYAIGAMLYQLLTGTPPYVPPGERVSAFAILRQTIHGPPPEVESLAPRAIPELVAICERAMARDPGARYSSMRALADDLQAFLDGKVVRAYETGAWAETRKWVKRNKALTTALSAAVALLVFGISGTLMFKRRSDANARAAIDQLVAAELSSYRLSVLGAQAAFTAEEPASLRRMLDLAPHKHRSLEWWYFQNRSDNSLWKSKGHSDRVTDLRFSSDSARLVSVADDGSSVLWDPSTGKVRQRLKYDGVHATKCAFSGDGRKIALAGWSELAIASADTGELLATLDFSDNTEDRPVWTWQGELQFSPKADTLMTTLPHSSRVRVWDANDYCVYQEFGRAGSQIVSALYLPDGVRLFTATTDGVLSIWDVARGEIVSSVETGGTRLKSVTMSNDGRLFAFCGESGSNPVLGTWSGDNSPAVRLSVNEDYRFSSLELSRYGTLLLALSWGGQLGRLIEPTTGATVWVGGPPELPSGIGYTPRCILNESRNEVLFARHCELYVHAVHSLDERRVLTGCEAPVYVERLSPDGSKVAAGTVDGAVLVWQLSHVSLFEEEQVQSVGDDSSCGAYRLAETAAQRLVVEATASGETLSALEQHHEAYYGKFRFSANGERVAGVSSSWVRIWDRRTGRHVRDVRRADIENLESDEVRFDYAYAESRVNHDGSSVLVMNGAQRGKLLVGLRNSSEAVVVDPGCGFDFGFATFSPTGDEVFLAHPDGLHIFSVDSGLLTATLKRSTELDRIGESTRVIAVSSNGRWAVSGSSSAEPVAFVWDLNTRALRSTVNLDSASICAVFASDDDTIAFGTDRGAIHIVCASSPESSPVRSVHPGGVVAACFSPDGSRVFTVCEDGFVRVVDRSDGEILCRIGTRLYADTDYSAELRFLDDSGRLVLRNGQRRYSWRMSMPAVRSAEAR